MQAGDKAEQQHSDRRDPPKRRQRRGIEEQMVGFRRETPEQGRAESDADQDLDDDERHPPTQTEDVPHRDGEHQDG